MQNEKHRDSWIGELDVLESLPGEVPFDKAAAWDRLRQRMDGKRTTTRWIWYWAAACLFLAVIGFLFLKQEHKADFPAPASYAENPYKKKMHEEEADIKQTPVVVKAPAAPVSLDTPERIRRLPAKEKKPVIISDVAAILPPVIKVASNSDTVQSEPGSIAAAPVATPKMRVVHINDVGGDVIGNGYVYPEHKQFKISLSGPAGFASQIVIDKTQQTILSPKN